MTKALRWFGIEYAKTFGFCLMVALIIGFFMTLIAYPVETVTFIVVSVILAIAFAIFYGK